MAPTCPRCSEALTSVGGCSCPPCAVCRGSPSNAIHVGTSWVPLRMEVEGIKPHAYVAPYVSIEDGHDPSPEPKEPSPYAGDMPCDDGTDTEG